MLNLKLRLYILNLNQHEHCTMHTAPYVLGRDAALVNPRPSTLNYNS
jgi:hypothetical protein